MDSSLRKQLIIETAKLLNNIRKHKLGEAVDVTSTSLDKSLASLKQLAIKAQRKWEKEQQMVNEDDPKKDYGGYDIKNPESKYALRNLPPTDDPEELEKRKRQAIFERLTAEAPRNMLENYDYRNLPHIGAQYKRVYSSVTGREWVDLEHRLNRDFTEEEWELYQRGEEGKQAILANVKPSKLWIGIVLAALIRALLVSI